MRRSRGDARPEVRPAADPPTVLNHLGRDTADAIAAGVPGARVVDVPADGAVPDDVRGEVLLTLPWGTPNLGDVVARDVGWVHSLSTGVDKFPIDALPDDVTLTCSRGASAVPIAEFVLAAMLAFEKQLPTVWVREPPERWAMADLGGLEGRTLGLIGAGGIGTEVARRALAFGMQVCFVRRTDTAPPLAAMERCSLAQMLPAADHLVVAAPSTPATRQLLGAEALAGVKPGVHVVNVSRGSLIDQVALLDALDDGRVARATLDVADPEPLPSGHPLYAHPRVRLSPHVSWSAPGALSRLVDRFVANLRSYVAGQPLAGVVDRVAGY
jgi:phosphoglycerate dehydrogenase-like enzyme